MSAGVFEVKSYAASYKANTNHPITVQPETLTLVIGGNTNGDAIGAINNPISAVISRGKRQFGLRPRTVTIKFTGDVPEGYEDAGVITLPYLQTAGFDDIVRGTTGTYLGKPIRVVGKSAEIAR